MSGTAETMSQQAYSIIKDRVLNGTYALDQKISIKELTEGLGIGRSPVGEALKRLEHEGLITISPKSGNRIWNPTLAELEQLMAFRKMMEVGALRMARDVFKLSDDLLKLCHHMDEAMEDEDWMRYEAFDYQYHMTLIQSSGNQYLIDSYRLVADKIRLARNNMTRTFGQSNAGHYDIANALKRNAFMAERELDKHLTVSRERFTRS
ncbi:MULTISPECIES: GntR family transcriptional regulator [unclassified Halomonas]|uniref:GntR family transcriptional regulator n=1 Tax=unclassified Halomonas TaxID=2609666 RepID=UPI0012A8AD44|nr:GntR family transcriptional regulator [Halomonas sp. THAF12]QFT83766.1 putative HTH-type transcriptional regulator YdfH [Halomonas sp. THAF12]